MMPKGHNQHLIDLLRKTHNAEWEATPSAHDAIAWLSDLVQFLFPGNHLPKQTSYNGILKKNQIDLENILLSYIHRNINLNTNTSKTILLNMSRIEIEIEK